MQKYNLYAIYDMKAQTYGTPFPALNDALAARMVTQILQYGGNPDYQRYPEDFSVFCIGDFVDISALVTSHTPRLVFTLGSLISQVRGGAVGGNFPLKPQSANNSAADDAEKSSPACDSAADSSIKSTDGV